FLPDMSASANFLFCVVSILSSGEKQKNVSNPPGKNGGGRENVYRCPVNILRKKGINIYLPQRYE
ncbi:hypothetical protein ACXZ3C_005198, partial [Escherichia coli]